MVISQNRTLAESGCNGGAVHLFELLRPKEYTFRRQVELAAEPFQEEQKDSEEHLRKVGIELAEEQLVYMKEHNESLK